MPERADIFDDDLDLSGFTPKRVHHPEPPAHAVREVSELVNFHSREPVPVPRSPKKMGRPRSGRNIQLNTKVDEATAAMLYAIHDEHRDESGGPRWTLGQILRMALESLQREFEQQKRS